MLGRLGFSSGIFKRSTLRLRSNVFPAPRKPHVRLEHTSSANPTYNAKRYSRFHPTFIALGAVPILTFALGTWQLQRLQWKIALIDELTEKLEREPISLPSNVNIAAIPEFIYRKVILRGRWDHAHAMPLGPRVKDGTLGYHLITPLVRTNGSTVLVDRGFVAREYVEEGKPRAEDPEGEVEVCGMLRASQARNAFTPDNHPEQNLWYWTDVDAMAEFSGGAEANVQPVLVEEIFQGRVGESSWRLSKGIPVGKEAIVDVRNSHASYVVTWYCLSAFTTVMFIRLMLKQRTPFRRLPR